MSVDNNKEQELVPADSLPETKAMFTKLLQTFGEQGSLAAELMLERLILGVAPAPQNRDVEHSLTVEKLREALENPTPEMLIAFQVGFNSQLHIRYHTRYKNNPTPKERRSAEECGARAFLKAVLYCATKKEDDEIGKKANQLYTQYVDSSGIHCNRSPAWEELNEQSQQEWIAKAKEDKSES